MKIQIDPFDKKSIDTAILQIESYKNKLQEKANEIVAELGKIGEQIVDYAYANNEDDKCVVTCITSGNSSMIIAEGESVIFLEFGTGVYTEDHTQEMETSGLPEIYPGSWSITEGSGVFYRHGHWHYNGKDYVGTAPMRGFYMASSAIKEQAVEVAKRIFTK